MKSAVRPPPASSGSRAGAGARLAVEELPEAMTVSSWRNSSEARRHVCAARLRCASVGSASVDGFETMGL